MGLGWVADLNNGLSNVSAGNRSWLFGLRPAQDVLQPFVANAAVFRRRPDAGLNPELRLCRASRQTCSAATARIAAPLQLSRRDRSSSLGFDIARDVRHDSSDWTAFSASTSSRRPSSRHVHTSSIFTRPRFPPHT